MTEYTVEVTMRLVVEADSSGDAISEAESRILFSPNMSARKDGKTHIIAWERQVTGRRRLAAR